MTTGSEATCLPAKDGNEVFVTDSDSCGVLEVDKGNGVRVDLPRDGMTEPNGPNVIKTNGEIVYDDMGIRIDGFVVENDSDREKEGGSGWHQRRRLGTESMRWVESNQRVESNRRGGMEIIAGQAKRLLSRPASRASGRRGAGVGPSSMNPIDQARGGCRNSRVARRRNGVEAVWRCRKGKIPNDPV